MVKGFKAYIYENRLLYGKQYLHEMNVAELQNGMYIIHLLQNGEVVGTEKISIQH